MSKYSEHMAHINLTKEERRVFDALRVRQDFPTMTGMVKRLVMEEARRCNHLDLVARLNAETDRRRETRRAAAMKGVEARARTRASRMTSGGPRS